MQKSAIVFILGNIIAPYVIGRALADLVGCNFSNTYVNIPCWWLNFIFFAVLTAVAYDFVVYFIIPRIRKRRVKSNLRIKVNRDVWSGVVSATIFNDGNDDLEERNAEYLGFARVSKDGVLNQLDNGIIHDKDKVLKWNEKEERISPDRHGTINNIAVVDWQGVQFGRFITMHNEDESTWKVGVGVSGKIKGVPIYKRYFCITFVVRKNIKDNGEVLWLIGEPQLIEKDCDWIKTISAEEYLKTLEKRKRWNRWAFWKDKMVKKSKKKPKTKDKPIKINATLQETLKALLQVKKPSKKPPHQDQ